MTKPAQPLPALPFHPRGTQSSSLENRYFSRNSSSLSEHFLFPFKNMAPLHVCFITESLTSVINPLPHSSDILKPILGHIKTATLDESKFMTFLNYGKSQRQESDDVNDVIIIHKNSPKKLKQVYGHVLQGLLIYIIAHQVL